MDNSEEMMSQPDIWKSLDMVPYMMSTGNKNIRIVTGKNDDISMVISKVVSYIDAQYGHVM